MKPKIFKVEHMEVIIKKLHGQKLGFVLWSNSQKDAIILCGAWDPSFLPEVLPLSYRIVEDIDCVVEEAYIKIFQAKGVVVPHLGTRHGWRYDLGLNQLPQGGIMKKNRIYKKMDT